MSEKQNIKEDEINKDGNDGEQKGVDKIDHENPTGAAGAERARTAEETASIRLKRKLDMAFADLHANLTLARADVLPDSERAQFTHKAHAWLEEIKAFIAGNHSAAR